eukprot:sb/3477205/
MSHRLALVLERFHGHISKQNVGGRPPDKKSYLAPFSRYLHIYVLIYDFTHILNISTSAGPRKFSRGMVDLWGVLLGTKCSISNGYGVFRIYLCEHIKYSLFYTLNTVCTS